MGPRAGLSVTLVVAGAVLLIAIAVGNEMGNRVLGQATERGPAILATPVASSTPGPDANPAAAASWRRVQVVTVATDPAFPDPRITPEPPPTPRPATPRPPTPTPKPPVLRSPTPSVPYTSPPLPIPLVTHGDTGASASPEAAAESPSPGPSPVSGG